MAKDSGLSYQQLTTAFRHGNFEPLYFFFGEETFLMDELQELLVSEALEEHERDFNFDLVYGAEAEASQVLSVCSGYPVMAQRRVVVVRDFHKLENNRQFKSYAERPNPHAVVLLICSTKPNLSAHPYRALKQHGAWSEFKPLYDNKIPGWVQARVESLGRTIEPRAAQRLVEFIGTDLHSAASEIDKLITHVGERREITAEDVVRAGGQFREFNVFELQDAIGTGRCDDAQRIMTRMLAHANDARGESLMIVAMLNRYFEKLWKLQPHLGGAPDKYEVARLIGVSPYFASEYVQAARRTTRGAVEAAFGALLAADAELKGGSQRSAQTTMTLVLRRLCR